MVFRHLAMVTIGKYEVTPTIRSPEQEARWKEDNKENRCYILLFLVYIDFKV